uniref:PH domain-containing protein n=1 Tax=Vombatus ursinus TaxID=29139 RepID=A0A4X2KUW8_VOMUR
MPYVDRQNRICGFLDIEDNETSGKFLRRYFILDTQANSMSLWLTLSMTCSWMPLFVAGMLIGDLSSFCLVACLSAVINALSQRYFLQANDQKDLKDWVEALNQASKITVRMVPFPSLRKEDLIAKQPLALTQQTFKHLCGRYHVDARHKKKGKIKLRELTF